MRYEKGRKEATRQRIIDVASQKFRRHGIAATGLAGIMQEADLTVGAFYPHFESKSQLVSESLTHVLDLEHSAIKRMIEENGGLEGAIRGYLSKGHRDGPADGCPSAALLPEVARQTDDARAAYAKGLRPFIEMIAKQLPEGDAARGRAVALFGLLVGTLQIARAVPDEDVADYVLQQGIEAAISLASGDPASSVISREKKPVRRVQAKT
ncbi:TetR/AcrR family transcriptional regulator [Mesorhizobium sp. 2RAF21]|uniref:TetR/AcrR family transcriptional regulator n=1 Tax=Mesorhizobium sp. 2RAF21 TaxID=3232995 RepID=UPI003F9980B1